jgi:hypothetical protein
MAEQDTDDFDVRAAVLTLLLRKVRDDQYPSNTMMDMIEGLLEPEDVPAYARVLMDKIRRDQYPSIPMMRRLVNLG